MKKSQDMKTGKHKNSFNAIESTKGRELRRTHAHTHTWLDGKVLGCKIIHIILWNLLSKLWAYARNTQKTILISCVNRAQDIETYDAKKNDDTECANTKPTRFEIYFRILSISLVRFIVCLAKIWFNLTHSVPYASVYYSMCSCCTLPLRLDRRKDVQTLLSLGCIRVLHKSFI